MRYAFLVAPLAILSSAGCFSFLADAQGGFVASTTMNTDRMGAAVNLSAGMNATGNVLDHASVEHKGPGIAVRTKFTREVQQVSLSPHYYFLRNAFVSPYARAGVNLLQLENINKSFAFGMFSPYAEIGMFLGPIVTSAFVEYDLRFTHQPNEGFFGFMIGYGLALSTAGM